MRSLDKNILMEHNILKNPFNTQFRNSCYKIQNGKIKFLNQNGLGVELIKNNKHLIYEEKV